MILKGVPNLVLPKISRGCALCTGLLLAGARLGPNALGLREHMRCQVRV